MGAPRATWCCRRQLLLLVLAPTLHHPHTPTPSFDPLCLPLGKLPHSCPPSIGLCPSPLGFLPIPLVCTWLFWVSLMCRLWGSSLSQRCPNKVWVQMGPFVGSTIRSQMPRPQNLPEPVPEAGGTGQAWSPGGAPCKCIGFQAPFALLTVAEGKVGGMGWGQGWPG